MSVAFFGYWVLKHEFWILVAKLPHFESTKTSFSFTYISTMSLKTTYVKLTKFLCTNSQGIQIIGNTVEQVKCQSGTWNVQNKCSGFQFSVFMWHHHIRKLKITFPSEVSVPSDKRPYRTLTFHNVLARQGSSFCNRARLNFQAFALRDTKVAAQEGCRVGQKMSYRFSFC